MFRFKCKIATAAPILGDPQRSRQPRRLAPVLRNGICVPDHVALLRNMTGLAGHQALAQAGRKPPHSTAQPATTCIASHAVAPSLCQAISRTHQSVRAIDAVQSADGIDITLSIITVLRPSCLSSADGGTPGCWRHGTLQHTRGPITIGARSRCAPLVPSLPPINRRRASNEEKELSCSPLMPNAEPPGPGSCFPAPRGTELPNTNQSKTCSPRALLTVSSLLSPAV
jgi:hypothetical protein